jgi:exosortase/archaeosortase family protein
VKKAFQKIKEQYRMIARSPDHKITRYFIKLFLFVILYKAGEYLFKYLEQTELLSGVFGHFYDILSGFITVVTVTVWSLFYSEIHSTPGFLIVIDNVPTIQMMKGCTGLMQLFQILFILILFPMQLKQKAIFLPVSVFIITFAAILHYIFLVPVAFSFNDQFTLFHDIISRVIFYIFFFTNFVLWNRYPGKSATNRQPDQPIKTVK